MSYISSFELENFRTFRKPTRFDFAPLTILTGPNSSGKSSLIKALLLLRDSRSDNQLKRLAVGAGSHNLRSLNSVTSFGGSEEIRFVTRIPNPFGDNIPVAFPDQVIRDLKSDRIVPQNMPFDWQVDVDVEIIFKAGTAEEVRFLAVEETDVSEIARVGTAGQPATHPIYGDYEELFVYATYQLPWFLSKLGDSVETAAERLGIADRGIGLEFVRGLSSPETLMDGPSGGVSVASVVGLLETADHRFSDDPMSSESFRVAFLRYTLSELFRRVLEQLRRALESLEFSGEWNTQPQRVHQSGSASGDFTEVLRRYSNDGISSGGPNDWLKEFGIGDRLIVDDLDDGLFRLRIQKDGYELPDADIGKGHFRLIPLILHIDVASYLNTLLVEEPEANLHPNLQSRLADLFVDLIGEKDELPPPVFDQSTRMISWDKTGVLRNRLIVETHSEYLIRRLQYLVATKKVDPSRVVIYYFGADSEADDYIRKITVNEKGQLSSDFGPGFFDESTSLMADLYRHSQN